MSSLKSFILSVWVVLFFAIPAFAQNAPFDQAVNTVITDYLALKNALASSDGRTSATKGQVLLNSLNQVPQAGLNGGQRALLIKLRYDSRHISEVNKIDDQREHFASLSENLYTLVQKAKSNQVTLYRRYCTTAKAYFLSDADKDKDPYTGTINASKVTETLAVAKK
jgi:hypothetical protein